MRTYQKRWQALDKQSGERFLNTPRLFSPLLVGTILGFFISSSSFAATQGWSQQPVWAGPANYNSSGAKNSSQQPQASPFAPGSNNLAINLGQTFLMGDLSKDYSDNLGFKIGYTYGVSDIFGFEANLGHSSHSQGGFSMSHLNFGLRTNLAWFDRIIPYLSFGLGFYRPSYTFLGTGTTPSETLSPLLFGIHLGPGVNLQLTNRLFFGTSLTFHDIFGAEAIKADGKKLQAGGTFTSLLIHAGMSF